MDFFSGKKTEKNTSRSSDDTQELEVRNDNGKSIFVLISIFVFVFSFSYLLSFVYQIGKMIAYRMPLSFVHISWPAFFVIMSILALSMVFAFILETFFGVPVCKNALEHSQRITYYFSILATLAVAIYLGYGLIFMLSGGSFFWEAIYVLVLYGLALFPHFIQGKTPLVHGFVSMGFMFILVVCAFYGGLAKGRTEDKLMMSYDGESYILIDVHVSTLILSGFDKEKNRFNEKILVLYQKDLNGISFYRYSTVRD